MLATAATVVVVAVEEDVAVVDIKEEGAFDD